MWTYILIDAIDLCGCKIKFVQLNVDFLCQHKHDFQLEGNHVVQF